MKYFRLFSNCVLTKGALNATITDLQRGRIQYIPSALYDLLIGIKHIEYPYKDETVNDYLEHFLNNEFGFLYDKREKEFFPDIQFNFEVPKCIYNVVIDFGAREHPLQQLARFINYFSPTYVSLRFFDKWPIHNYLVVLDMLESLPRQTSVDITIPFFTQLNDFFRKTLGSKYFNVCQILQHSCTIPASMDYVQGVIMKYTDVTITDERCCGVINKNNFAVNMTAFAEAKNMNSCLNGKLSIDKDGEIRNCPSMKESYGNILNTSPTDLIKNNDITKFWTKTKDDILVCRDCEFRYVCTDCRAYTEDPNNDYSKPLKCGYDPYTGEWSEWSQSPLKENAMRVYKLQK